MIGKNNPFNIRKGTSKWVGQTGIRRGFCEFDTLEHGVRAAAIIIFRSYWRKGFQSPHDIINRFAPPVENNTSAYVVYMCTKLNLLPTKPVPPESYTGFLYYMAIYESQCYLDMTLIREVLKKLDLLLDKEKTI